MKLVIVETPAQAKILADQLGSGWRVEPCYGMLRNFPAKALGVEMNSSFRPTFTILRGKGGIVIRLKKALRDAEAVYTATPPGPDGELMAWHVLALVPDLKPKPVYRVTLDALTPDAIRAAFAAPRPSGSLRSIPGQTTSTSTSRAACSGRSSRSTDRRSRGPTS